MQLDHIALQGFRNIGAASLDLSPKTVALVGKNAQGKTNLVEAVYLLACLKSFRNRHWRDLIRHGEKQAVITAQISGDSLPFTLKLVLDAKEGKSIYKNGVKITRLSDFLGLFRVVLFCPEHLSLIKEGPAKRRSFLDSAICQLRPYYASLLNECAKIEAQRAALLKLSRGKKPDPALFAVWDERLAGVSVKIASIRADYVRRLQEAAPAHFSRISDGKESLSLSFVSDVYREGAGEEEMRGGYLSLLSENLESDIKYGFTGKGIHRDDLEVKIDAFSARGFASQGQQRSAVLALKLAEGEISRDMTGRPPVYLLDDVLSELDEGRRSYILSGLAGKQVILTGTDRDQLDTAHQLYFVEGGCFSS